MKTANVKTCIVSTDKSMSGTFRIRRPGCDEGNIGYAIAFVVLGSEVDSAWVEVDHFAEVKCGISAEREDGLLMRLVLPLYSC